MYVYKNDFDRSPLRWLECSVIGLMLRELPHAVTHRSARDSIYQGIGRAIPIVDPRWLD
jgi:hypothetical protein